MLGAWEMRNAKRENDATLMLAWLSALPTASSEDGIQMQKCLLWFAFLHAEVEEASGNLSGQVCWLVGP